MEINNFMNTGIKPAFKGYQNKKTEYGTKAYSFNFPYNYQKEDCEVEFYNVKENPKNFNCEVVKDAGKAKSFHKIALTPQGASIEDDELGNNPNAPVAYRYKITNKETGKVRYATDNAKDICDKGFNLINRRATTVTKQGPMYLAIPDSFAPGYVYAGFKSEKTGDIIKPDKNPDVSKFDRTFSNKAGGTLAGLEAKVPELRKAGYKKLITTPILGGDSNSSHDYWLERPFQTASQLGSIDNFDSLQKKLFKNGMNYVSDGAYTSQGLNGANFQYALRWMNQEDKPHEYYMFRMQGLENDALGLGVVPKNMENLRHKVVNSPNNYETQKDGSIKIVENKKYDRSQPTYIQIYDDSLVSDEQRNDTTKLIKTYAKSNQEKDGKVNKLGINTHDDTNIPYSFKIDPKEYDANIVNFNTMNKNIEGKKIGLNTPQGTMLVGKFSGLKIEPKNEGGFVAWDSNTDMAKLAYVASDYDTQLLDKIQNPKERDIENKKLDQAHFGNRDSLAGVMQYWTKRVRNVDTEYTAKTLGAVDGSADKVAEKINSLTQKSELPKDAKISKEIVANVLSDDYILRDKESDYTKALDATLMDLPLDSLELANDTVGALSSPYLSKRSPDKEHIGESRYEAMNDDTYKVPEKYVHTYNKMNNIFTTQIHTFADDVLKNVNDTSKEKLFDNDGQLTEYGQYVVPMVAGDIAKYALIKSLVPTAETKQLKNGQITYDYKKLEKEATLEKLGINGESPEDEANQIADKIRRGTKDLNSADVSIVSRAINKRIEGTNTNSFKLAEVMVDRSGLGLDWRIDAAKDVADMDAIRNRTDNYDHQMKQVIDVWKPAIDSVKKENPNSYVVAEFTDFDSLMNSTYGEGNAWNPANHKDGAFETPVDTTVKILNKTGMNTEANYSHFYSDLMYVFGRNFESGKHDKNLGSFEGAIDRFSQMPIDYQRNAYTFGGNHDKPRMTECYGMDMGMFHDYELSKPEIEVDSKDADYVKEMQNEHMGHRTTAYMIMNDKMNENDLKPEDWNIIHNSKTYFDNVSSKAIAKADWLRSSIGMANEITKQQKLAAATTDEEKNDIETKANKTYAALSQSIADIVKGDYYLNDEESDSTVDSMKKQTEKDGFGTKDIPTALSIVMDQAKEKHGLDESLNDTKDYSNLVEKVAIGVASNKLRLYSAALSAIPGNPTTFAGDELGMTGYEEKCHNVYLQNRNPLDWSSVDESSENKKDYIINHRNEMNDIVSSRNDEDDRVEALNHGTMFRLETQNGKGGKCPAILTQDVNGAMNISLFNMNNLPKEGQLRNVNITPDLDIDKLLSPKASKVTLDNILLKGKKDDSKIDMPNGVQFRNLSSSDKSIYETRHDKDGNLLLSKKDGKGFKPIEINETTAKNGVLRLYHRPEDVNFKGLHNAKEYFNPKYNIAVSNPYAKQNNNEVGSKLSLISK